MTAGADGVGIRTAAQIDHEHLVAQHAEIGQEAITSPAVTKEMQVPVSKKQKVLGMAAPDACIEDRHQCDGTPSSKGISLGDRQVITRRSNIYLCVAAAFPRRTLPPRCGRFAAHSGRDRDARPVQEVAAPVAG